MSDQVVRMHLAQALTRAETTAVRNHLQAALDHLDRDTPSPKKDRISHEADPATAAAALETWLVHNARCGVPEFLLQSVLRAYAAKIDAHGCVPRSWTNHTSQPAEPTTPDP
jgi:hypothetical protein